MAAANFSITFCTSSRFGAYRVPLLQKRSFIRTCSSSNSSEVAIASRSSSKSKSTGTASKSGHGGGLKKPVDISPTLQQFLGVQQASRADTMKSVWDYIKAHNLQAETDRRRIVCDEKLKSLLGKDEVNFLEIAGLLNPHFLKNT
ncbi:hypothetical protein KP509_28G033100 [Ceratopteris richardii]|uniref:DM2 domain-containing protein n=1 Tax=Ceratopteris richardii TaxID=49495 RepID=A0A8T2RB06_CERRI|nr:hypothetical protein KP509_28G033100 [Ceratopteris richardii]